MKKFAIITGLILAIAVPILATTLTAGDAAQGQAAPAAGVRCGNCPQPVAPPCQNCPRQVEPGSAAAVPCPHDPVNCPVPDCPKRGDHPGCANCPQGTVPGRAR